MSNGRMGIGRVVFACTLLAATSLGARADDRVVIRCKPTCRLTQEPPRGKRVHVEVDAGPATADLKIANLKLKPCRAPCDLNWPGAANLQVLSSGDVHPIHVGPLPTFHGDLPVVDARGFRLSSDELHIRLHDPRIQLTGPDVTPTPPRPPAPPFVHVSPPPGHPVATAPPGQQAGESTTIHGGTEVPSRGLHDPSSLDRYFDDVVLVGTMDAGCTGVIVSAHQVLTARHCIDVATQVQVEGIAHQMHSFPVTGHAEPPDPDIDVTLLTVLGDLGIEPRPRARTVSDGPFTGVAEVLGYGTNDADGRLGFGRKREALLVVSRWTCDQQTALATGCRPYELVLPASTVDTCSGDSGGPVLDHAAGRWRLVGITSRGVPGAGSACGRGGVYTEVGAISCWLDQQLLGRVCR